MKLEVGAGAHPRAGYEHLDIVAGPGIDLVCPAWKTPLKSDSVEEIYARHFMEHLSQPEADQTIVEWQRLLVAGGVAHVIVPNMEFHGAQVLLPGNSEFFKRKKISNLDHALYSIYGWPGEETMRHKWGYTPATLTALFVGHGFVDVTVLVCRACDIELRARKASK